MKAIITLGYILAAAMLFHVALIGIHIAERGAVWIASEAMSLRQTGRAGPP